MTYWLLMLAFLAYPAYGWAQERVKIGFIDLQRVMTDSVAGKQSREKFQAQVKKAEADLLKEKQDLERSKADLDKKGPLLKEEERRSLESDLQRRVVNYQRNMQDQQQQLRQQEREMTADLLKELEKIVNEVGKADKFTLILERSNILYSDQAIDVTSRVIEVYNSRMKKK